MLFEAERLPPRRRRANSDDGMIPLINIVFLLLVFFMVAGKVAQQDAADFDAPDSVSQMPLAEAPHTLLVSADARLWLDGEALLQLDGEALTRAGIDAGQRLVLKADANLPARRLDHLLQVLRSAGLRQVELAVESGEAP